MKIPKKPKPANECQQLAAQERWKSHFLSRVKASGEVFHRWAWDWAEDQGIILATERLEDGVPWRYPQTKEAVDYAGAIIKANMEFGIMGPERIRQYEAANEEDELPM